MALKTFFTLFSGILLSVSLSAQSRYDGDFLDLSQQQIDVVENKLQRKEEVEIEEKENKEEKEEKKDKSRAKKRSRAERDSGLSYFALKTNIAMWGGGVINGSFDFRLFPLVSLNTSFFYSPWNLSKNFGVKTLGVEPELRCWFSECGKGHFLALYGLIGSYNLSYEGFRYQDNVPMLGTGLNYGYLLPLSPSWGLEFGLGMGYSSFRYNKFYDIDNGAQISSGFRPYWGVTKVDISVVYRF